MTGSVLDDEETKPFVSKIEKDYKKKGGGLEKLTGVDVPRRIFPSNFATVWGIRRDRVADSVWIQAEQPIAEERV
jgi:hypothetical protein